MEIDNFSEFCEAEAAKAEAARRPKRSGYFARCACGCGAVTDLVSDKGPAKETAKSVAKLVRSGLKVEHSDDVDADGTMDAFDSCRAKKIKGGA